MAIPDYQSFMLPLLTLSADGEEHTVKAAVAELSGHFELSDDDRAALLPSGTQSVVYNRVGWARTYMRKAGLLEFPSRGRFLITERGKELLAENPDKIDVKLLSRYAEFEKFKTAHKEPTNSFPHLTAWPI